MEMENIIDLIGQFTGGYFVEYPYITGILAAIVITIGFTFIYNLFYALAMLISGKK